MGHWGKGKTMLFGGVSMYENKFYKLYLAFLSELTVELKEKYPELSEDQRRMCVDIVIDKLLLDPVNAVSSVSELRDSLPFVHNA